MWGPPTSDAVGRARSRARRRQAAQHQPVRLQRQRHRGAVRPAGQHPRHQQQPGGHRSRDPGPADLPGLRRASSTRSASRRRSSTGPRAPIPGRTGISRCASPGRRRPPRWACRPDTPACGVGGAIAAVARVGAVAGRLRDRRIPRRRRHRSGLPRRPGVLFRRDRPAHASAARSAASSSRSADQAGVLGMPTSDERVTPDRVGRFQTFQHGLIYWNPATGAHLVPRPDLRRMGQGGLRAQPAGIPGVRRVPHPSRRWLGAGVPGRGAVFQPAHRSARRRRRDPGQVRRARIRAQPAGFPEVQRTAACPRRALQPVRGRQHLLDAGDRRLRGAPRADHDAPGASWATSTAVWATRCPTNSRSPAACSRTSNSAISARSAAKSWFTRPQAHPSSVPRPAKRLPTLPRLAKRPARAAPAAPVAAPASQRGRTRPRRLRWRCPCLPGARTRGSAGAGDACPPAPAPASFAVRRRKRPAPRWRCQGIPAARGGAAHACRAPAPAVAPVPPACPGPGG